MRIVRRLYDALLEEHLATHRQMVFVSGPRQVGKTTSCRRHCTAYLNWDNLDDRELILAGPTKLADRLDIARLSETPPIVLFDEIHKLPRWKQVLKGLFDTYADRLRIIVTGSSSLDTYRRGGDSLMGRYFAYRMHPFSVAEMMAVDLPDPERVVRRPRKPPEEDFSSLWKHGGFPEPLLKRSSRFSVRWQTLRDEQVLREDVRDMTQIQQIDQLELLARLLVSRSSRQASYSKLANGVRVSVDTIRRWVQALSALHLGFQLRPWFANVPRSLRKEPKWFARDWSTVEEAGNRAETFVGCHLLKAVEGWTDMGLGSFDLRYLRDKQQREVDFAVIRDGEPWFLVEVKLGDSSLSPSLAYFQEKLGVRHAFQVVLDAEYIDADCFASPGRGPVVVPARTFLSQLL